MRILTKEVLNFKSCAKGGQKKLNWSRGKYDEIFEISDLMQFNPSFQLPS